VTESVWFALIAALALGGWAFTLTVVTKAILPMANAVKVHQGIVDREDAKVFSLTERTLKLRNHGAPPKDEVARPTGTGPMADAMRAGSMDQGGGFIDEQPDSGMDIVE
jgi:hypothetical protein